MSAWCDIHECWLGRWQSADLVDDRRFEDGVLRWNGVAVRDRNFHLRGKRIHGHSHHARLPRLARFQAVGIRALDPEGACVSRGSRVKRLFYHVAGNHNLGHPRRQSIRQEKPPVLRQFRGGLLFGAFSVMSA